MFINITNVDCKFTRTQQICLKAVVTNVKFKFQYYEKQLFKISSFLTNNYRFCSSRPSES